MKAKSQVGKVAIGAVDHVVINRLHDAHALVARARAALPPNCSHEVIADAVIKRVATEMAAVGAASGAVAAAPAIGTAASVATTAADIGLAFGRIATMVMAVGMAYGHDMSDLEQRKGWVYHVLSGAGGQLTPGERKAGDLKRQLGEQALGSKTPGAGVAKINEVVAAKVGSKVASRLVRKELAVKVATLIPLGIGAGIGAVGNRALVRSVGRQAKQFFDTWPKHHQAALTR
jgi:EcsC protein family